MPARLAPRLAASLLVATAAVTGTATSANAYTYTNSGSVGSVSVPVTDAAGSTFSPSLVVNARTIGKVAAYSSSNQYVTVTSALWAIVPMPNSKGYPYWAKVDSSQRSGWIQGAQTSIRDSGNTFGSSDIFTGKGYSVTVTVTWQLANGTVIGRKVLDYSQTGDYRVLNGLWKTGTTNWGGGSFVMYTA